MYTNCRSLSLYNFQEISETQDLTFLLEEKDKDVSNDVLLEIYQDILEEYNSLIGNDSYKYKHRLKSEINYCYNKLKNLEIIYNLCVTEIELDDLNTKEVNSICSNYRTKFNKESLQRSISGIVNRINIKTEELKEKSIDSNTTFDDFFISIIKEYGINIDKRT